MYYPLFEDVLKSGSFDTIDDPHAIISQSVMAPVSSARYLRMYMAAWECISSAAELQDVYDKGVSHTTNGCTVIAKTGLQKVECYLCRHAVELMLKGLCLEYGVEYPTKPGKGHSLQCILDVARDAGYNVSAEIDTFISEIDTHDPDGTIFRYFEGRDKVSFDPASYKLNTAAFLKNCERMYNSIVIPINKKQIGSSSMTHALYDAVKSEQGGAKL